MMLMWYQKLESLDELILNKFQRVTEEAHQKLGWTKYDLAHLCHGGTGVSFTAMGTYATIAGTLGHNGFLTGLGVISVGLGYAIYKYLSKEAREEEKKELLYLVEHNAPRLSHPIVVRPIEMGVAAFFGIQTMATLFYGVWWETPKWLTMNKDEYELLSNVLSGSAAIFLGANVAASYFRDTTMFPPQKERNILPRIKNFVTGKGAVEVPELSKVSTNI